VRADVVADHHGFLHETAFYSSDDELLAIVIPFLRGGIKAGEPTLVALGAGNTELVRAAMGDISNISFVDAYRERPANTVKNNLEILATHLARDAQRIRIIGDVPHPGTGRPWEWWARYEAAANHIYAHFPLWAICPYDTRITPDNVLTDVMRTHPHVATADGRHVPNARFEDPAEFLTNRPAARADPLEATPPMIDLVNPTPAGARLAVRDASRGCRLDGIEVEKFVLAVNETVINALCHGRPPVRVRLWPGLDRLVTTITDRGNGPTDPFIGLAPAKNGSSGGVGLWLTHHMCSLVTLGRDDDGFTIRLVIGTPSLAA